MAKKKILFFVEAMGGGVFTYITNLANNLVNNFDMYVAYGIRSQTPKNFEKFFNKSVHLIQVKNFKRQISVNDIKAFYEMKKIVQKIQPDIIHLHSSKAGVLGRWAFNGEKTPVFYTPHGYSFLMKNIPTRKKVLFRFVERISALKNCTTISCSYGEDRETKKFTKQALYIDNGINTDYIDCILGKNKIKSNKKFTIFTLGRISAQKNPQLFNKIATKFPNIDFVWIGDGELRNKLTSPNITVTGWLSIEDALRKAINFNAFLLTSEWEGLPMALLEAMYIKKPCIVSNVIGNNNVIQNDVNGVLCNTMTDYCIAIDNLITHNNNYKSMVTKGYEDIIKKYNSVVMAEKYKKVYLNALDAMNRN